MELSKRNIASCGLVVALALLAGGCSIPEQGHEALKTCPAGTKMTESPDSPGYFFCVFTEESNNEYVRTRRQELIDIAQQSPDQEISAIVALTKRFVGSDSNAMGWEGLKVTALFYDVDGRPVETMVPVEFQTSPPSKALCQSLRKRHDEEVANGHGADDYFVVYLANSMTRCNGGELGIYGVQFSGRASQAAKWVSENSAVIRYVHHQILPLPASFAVPQPEKPLPFGGFGLSGME